MVGVMRCKKYYFACLKQASIIAMPAFISGCFRSGNTLSDKGNGQPSAMAFWPVTKPLSRWYEPMELDRDRDRDRDRDHDHDHDHDQRPYGQGLVVASGCRWPWLAGWDLPTVAVV
ncbi:hypothetical protein BJD16_09395 [Aeromonas sobria]|uniref:Lipoprotein n=1 Tax=Aeromonas sobria TaxID=646 RepID=A0A1S2D467_AERSO|nr:hypothetical protein BJD16_09395 [Aeromonas sobria]